MAFLSFDHPWAFVFGLLGNILSFMVYLAPVPTFCRICRKKSTEGFQSFPYVVALFSAMQLIYYAVIKTNTYLLITVNTAGCIIEITYLTIYLIYAPKKAKINTVKWMVLLNVVLFSIILLISLACFKGADRIKVVVWFNITFSVSVFAAPLSIIRLVIRTKKRGVYAVLPVILPHHERHRLVLLWSSHQRHICCGFTFGVIQMVPYIVYKDFKKGKQGVKQLDEQVLEDITKLSPIGVDVSKIQEKPVEDGVCKGNVEAGGNKRTRDIDVAMNQV